MSHGTELQMRIMSQPLAAGLYVLATPIGSARDITLRVLDVLNSADILVAEDTRVLRHLMNIHGIPVNGRRILTYHEHNAEHSRPELLKLMQGGASMAYSSDAGTPLVADPGFRLVRDCVRAEIPVTALPGPSAVIAGLSLSGLSSDRFAFLGFVPASGGARRQFLADAAVRTDTVIYFDTPRRVKENLGILCEICPERPVAICRELTKRFEEVIRGTVLDVDQLLDGRDIKGEIVVALGRATAEQPSDGDLLEMLRLNLSTMPVGRAASEVSKATGVPRKILYDMALGMKGEE